MKRVTRLFAVCEDGYVLVLSLLLLPILLGFGLLVIDVGRGNNAHSDLSAAADAVALAGARELDGNADAIARAKVAMGNLTNNVGMLGMSGPDMNIQLVYADASNNEFSVLFLDDMPAEDTTPLTTAYLNAHRTTVSADAKYVYVAAQSRNLGTAFFNPVNLLPSSVPIGATAVAKSVSATCNITPLYICNPFEASAGYSGAGLQDRFNEGALHARLLRLHPKGNATHAPGNFGFLQVEGANGNTSASANALRQIFAGRRNGTCYEAGRVTTKPGAATSISQGINTKFDIWSGPFSGYRRNANNNDFEIYPARNVRKGHVPGNGAQGACNATASDDHFGNQDGVLQNVYGFPDNYSMLPPGAAVPGATIAAFQSDWDLTEYWSVNHGSAVPQAVLNASSFAGGGAGANTTMPSRYDVYQWENSTIVGNNMGLVGQISTGGESGRPNCGLAQNPNPITPREIPDPRLIYAAIIDCNDPASIAQGGGINTYNVNSYAELFITRPMGKNGNGNNATTTTYIDANGDPVVVSDATIDVEITRITGAGDGGALENFVRNESILVR